MIRKESLGALTLIVALASSNSLGLNVPICDTDNPEIWKPLPSKCSKEKALGGDDCALGYAMWWAKAPKHTDRYKTFASTSPTSTTEASSYSPGGLLYIHIRATQQNLKYRGLLLYALDRRGNKVGSWELPYEVMGLSIDWHVCVTSPTAQEEQMFHTPPGSCEGKAVMHSGAVAVHWHSGTLAVCLSVHLSVRQPVCSFALPSLTDSSMRAALSSLVWLQGLKHYHHVFPFRAPAVGTGRVTFKTLLKSGPANTGAFHWANKDGPLTLNELKKVDAPGWYKAESGQSCKKACQARGGTCNSAKLTTVSSEAGFLDGPAKNIACKLPILGGCAQTDPSQNAKDGFCRFHQQGCNQEQSCGRWSAGLISLCPCDGVSNAAKKVAETPAQPKCDSYCKRGCEWTKKWACPWSSTKAKKAANTGEIGYSCCCEVNTKEGGCGTNAVELPDVDSWVEVEQATQPVCNTITDTRACLAANCVPSEQDGMTTCDVNDAQLHDMATDL